jgi:hypothetical protein
MLLRATDFHLYKQPEVPLPEVQLELPQSKNLKNVIDRLNKIAR